MTTATITRPTLDAIPASGLRAPDTDGSIVAPTVVCTWTPDLSAAEQAILDDLGAMTRAHITGLSLDEYRRMVPDLATLKTFRQMAQADWMALTANAREKQTFDVLNALQALVRALLRD
jgi:hypothetical protein